jgi:hypothetical protein
MIRSIGALFVGVLASLILTLATDVMLNAVGVFPAIGEPMSDRLLVVATVYRILYGVVGGYIAARLAPSRPMMHALALGALGLAVSAIGAVATWKKGPAQGHEWYPLALVALALPPAWAGGRLRELQQGGRADRERVVTSAR